MNDEPTRRKRWGVGRGGERAGRGNARGCWKDNEGGEKESNMRRGAIGKQQCVQNNWRAVGRAVGGGVGE